MHVHSAELAQTAVYPDQYPTDGLPEVALAGRSNVGKSSFINKLIQRKDLARTSSQPGKTQTLNFYTINEIFRLVDVPGYGYARVSKKERQQWAKMIERYLADRDQLALLFLLMDGRHSPTELDKGMYRLAEEMEIPFAIVLTKMDKIKPSQWNKHFSMYKKALDLPSLDAVFPFSAKTGQGSKDIWDVIQTFVLDCENDE